jgi:DNA-binding transcriptional LysR family regulator
MKKGHLRLAVVTTAKYYAPRMLGIFCQKYPGIDVSLKVTNRERLLERLSQNMDDLYIIGRPPQDEDSRFIHLIENPLVVIASREHPLSLRNAVLTFEDIADQEFIIRERGSGTRTAIEKLFSNQGRKINIKMEFGSNEAIKHAVASGLGISILSRHTMSLGIQSGPLVELNVEGFPISWPWYIGFHSGKRLSVVAKTFLDFVTREAGANGQKTSCASESADPSAGSFDSL